VTRRTLELTDALREYVWLTSSREPDVLKELREETAANPMARMQIAWEQGQFMGLLARLVGVRRAIEVGVFTGYSSISVALAMPEDGLLIACDVSPEWTSIARRYWERAGVASKVELRLAPAVETLDELIASGQEASFDMVFIDADKSNYDAYYERALVLLRAGGLILIDNVLWGGRVADPSVDDADTAAIRRLNEKLHSDERIDLSLLPIADGVTLARKR
jgi:predicted O-methyltransferase YrrM